MIVLSLRHFFDRHKMHTQDWSVSATLTPTTGPYNGATSCVFGGLGPLKSY
jgi:hypothetical protein